MFDKHKKMLENIKRFNRTNEPNPEYKEIIRLHEMLEQHNIPHCFESWMDGWHIVYPDYAMNTCSIIEHFSSYGMEYDQLEIMGLLTDEENEIDSVVGYLSAENVFARIESDWNKPKGTMQ